MTGLKEGDGRVMVDGLGVQAADDEKARFFPEL